MLNLLVWALTGWWGIWALLLLPFHWADWFWSMQNEIVTLVSLVSALVLLRHGRFRAASLCYLGGIWFFATHVMALNGGIHSPVQVLYVTLPISAAWLLGYEAAYWVSGVCMSCALVFAVLEAVGVNVPRKIPGTPFGAWAVLGMACLIGGVPVAKILRDLRSALNRSRHAEHESQRTMERLQAEIEEHRRTEQALRESEMRFRITADTAPVMIWTGDVDQKATFFNRIWLDFTGRTLEQELGAGWTEGVHPDDLSCYLAGLSASCAERNEYHGQFRLRRADGEYRLVLCHFVPRFEADRVFRGYTASGIDITDFKRSEEEALARQKWESLGVLAGGIAHDFNNLLGGISAQSELLMEELQGSPSLESVSKIQSIAVRASEIVRQLMVYAGQESSTLELVDLAVVLRDMLPLMTISASKNATFEFHLPDGLPSIRANVAQIRQVLLNLVTNASEALEGKAGVITIRVTEPEPEDYSAGQSLKPASERCLRVEVSDTGCGMTDQIRAGIFDPFFSTKGPGRGLGLAAVQGIVRGHGGQISVVSSPGRGSRFEILLPCTTELRQAATHEAALDVAENFFATVLIIEDEEPLRRAVAKLLRAKGLRVLESGDGRTAIEVFQRHASEIDIAILDVTLPGLSGAEVLQNLREMKPTTKVIITSAYGREQAFAIINGEPSRPYIRKPYRLDELLDLIRTATAYHPASSRLSTPQS